MSASSKNSRLLEAVREYAIRDEHSKIIGIKPDAPEWAKEILQKEISIREQGELV